MYFDERENVFNYSDIEEIEYEEKETIFNNNHKENYKFEDNKIFDANNITINNFRNSTLNDLNSPSEGLNKGNMFKNIYDPYKKHIYKVVVRGERDEMLLKIQELTFAVKDLSLYLDVHPNDKEIYEQFKIRVNEMNKLKQDYEMKYGPLSVDFAMSNNYEWLKNPWPWDKGVNE